MSDPIPSPSQVRPPVAGRRPFVIQVLLVLGCTVLLTGGAIFGVVATCNFNSSSNSQWPQIFFWSAVSGLAIIVLCVLSIAAWGIWMIVKKLWEN